jgi:hypothetical protein
MQPDAKRRERAGECEEPTTTPGTQVGAARGTRKGRLIEIGPARAEPEVCAEDV